MAQPAQNLIQLVGTARRNHHLKCIGLKRKINPGRGRQCATPVSCCQYRMSAIDLPLTGLDSHQFIIFSNQAFSGALPY